MVFLLILVLSVLLYFLPGLVAKNRRHNNVNAIGALNLFLGWTLIGWVASLIWALTDNIDRTPVRPISPQEFNQQIILYGVLIICVCLLWAILFGSH